MKGLAAVGLLIVASLTHAFADEPHGVRYLGEWSDGRGEVLVFTANKVRVGSRVSSYKETSRSADERFFRFHITSGGGGFDGRFLSVEVGREEMKMRGYRSQADLLDDRNVAGVVAWSRDR